VLVDPASVPFLAGSEVDFADDLIGASFRWSIPTPLHLGAAGRVFDLTIPATMPVAERPALSVRRRCMVGEQFNV
jgi:hypothetical protein